MEKETRLDRFLGEMGKGSRSQIRQMAKLGRIRVNGQIEKRPERKIIPGSDSVELDGILVPYCPFEYFLLNKPQGVISATEDGRHRTVLDLLGEERRRDLFPVGRLDIDTEGILLITNDGELAHRLLSPKRHVDKTYFALVEGELPLDAARQMAEGLILSDGTQVMPARLELDVSDWVETAVPDWVEISAPTRRETSLRAKSGLDVSDTARENLIQPWIEEKEPPAGETREEQGSLLADNETGRVCPVCLTIQEGKFHQVKRMFEALGCRVVYLKRLSMGPLRLDADLAPGQYRRLTEEELALLRQATEAGKKNNHSRRKAEKEDPFAEIDPSTGEDLSAEIDPSTEEDSSAKKETESEDKHGIHGIRK